MKKEGGGGEGGGGRGRGKREGEEGGRGIPTSRSEGCDM